MDILIKPHTLNLVGSMNHFIISSHNEIDFILKYAQSKEIIVKHTYTPNHLSRIDVGLEKIIAPLLTFHLHDLSEAYRQNDIVKEFEVEIKESANGETFLYSFWVIRAGVDRLSDSPSAFLQANFLTWQPTVKPVTYYSPEFLTYYAVVDSVVKAQVYYEQQGENKEKLITLAHMPQTTAWTIPLQYAIIAGKIQALPLYYDVWVEDSNGNRLSYIQRYYASDIRSEEEQWILFENSLGGIDTFRAYGQTEHNAKHTHSIAEIEDKNEEYHVDTQREWKKNTGFLNQNERRWLLDFFPSLGKYIYVGNIIRKIAVTDSDVSYQVATLPSSYTFTYRYVDARPYLNLPRTTVPLEVLDIKCPDIGSFTIAPRLVEFPALSLSEGALFPIQSPYSQEWGRTTAGALTDFVVQLLTNAYADDGAIGHTHNNMSVLDSLSFMGEYLLHHAQKIKAGWADLAQQTQALTPNSKDWTKILRKDQKDAAAYLISFLEGLKVGQQGLYGINKGGEALLKEVKSDDFRPGLLDGKGFGMYTDDSGRTHVSADIIEARLKAKFAELAVQRFTFSSGDMGYTSAGCKVVKVVRLPSGDFRCYWPATDDENRTTNDWHIGDQAMAKTHNIIGKTTAMAANRYYWRLVVAVGEEILQDGNTYHYIDLSDTRGTLTLDINGTEHTCVGYDTSVENDEPKEGDYLVQMGSQTDVDRQYAYVVYVSEGKRVDYDGINDYDLDSHIVEIHSRDVNYILSNRFEIVSGGNIRTPLVADRGQWHEGAVSYHYDRWSHNNAMWLCNIGKGRQTTSEPGDGNAEWIKETYGMKGEERMQLVLDIVEGSVFYRPGQEHVATIEASIIRGNTDITLEYHPSQIVWTRESEADDTHWNDIHREAGTRINIGTADIAGKTAIVCTVYDRHGQTENTERLNL
ncbi:MAG: hypothetical protein PUK67_03575 [Prevotellaceae bacterium]|nr:hypothetical protein [Prevotellaceae bacterium]MDY3365116.1 hypothetical protein [Prevotella sp.]